MIIIGSLFGIHSIQRQALQRELSVIGPSSISSSYTLSFMQGTGVSQEHGE